MTPKDGSIEPTAPGWYMVRYSEFGSIEARYYDERGWQIAPGVTSFFGSVDEDEWWDIPNQNKTIPDWVFNLYDH